MEQAVMNQIPDGAEYTTVVTSSFSLSMLPAGESVFELDVRRLTREEMIDELNAGPYEPAIFRTEHSAFLRQILGIEIPVKRRSVIVYPNTRLLIAQYNGPKTMPTDTHLPPNGQMLFFEVAYPDWGERDE